MYQWVARDLRKKWTKEQEEYVRQNYNGEGSKLSNVLPFSANGIRNKADRLGIRNNKHFHHVTKTEIPKLSEYELGYIAAFLDGEGSIYESMKGQYKAQFANSDEMVIRWIHDILGIGKIRKYQPRGNQNLVSHVLCIERQGDVWGFLNMIIPYLKIKQFKANQVLKLLKEKHEKNIVSA